MANSCRCSCGFHYLQASRNSSSFSSVVECPTIENRSHFGLKKIMELRGGPGFESQSGRFFEFEAKNSLNVWLHRDSESRNRFRIQSDLTGKEQSQFDSTLFTEASWLSGLRRST